MSRITEYTAVNQFDAGDVLIKDGTGGTKTITAENAASEFKRLADISNDITNAINPVVESVNTIASSLSETEDTFVASKNYNIGDIFSVSNTIYKATATITAGSDIIPDTNCEVISVGDELMDVRNALNTKANTDGYYQSMTVGNAEQLVSSRYTVDNEPYLYRTSGGTADIGDREYDEIVGGSVVWNQLVDKSNFEATKTVSGITFTNNGDGSVTANGTAEETTTFVFISNLTSKLQLGHKYIINSGFEVSGSATTYEMMILRFNGTTNINVYTDSRIVQKTTESVNASTVQMAIRAGATVENLKCTPQIFDLTQMFGSEIADYVYNLEQTTPGAGVAWFRKYFPNDYYEYNTGEFKHVEGLSAHEMVGFNLWDEEWEVGELDSTNGNNKANSNRCRCKNFIKVFPNTTYYYTGAPLAFVEYDVNKHMTKAPAGFLNPRTFTTNANTRYIRFFVNTSTMPSNININLSWSGWRDGEYEPYVKHSYPLDPSLILRGVPKLSADGKLYFDGDRYASDGTVTRNVYEEDLGNCDWQYNSQYDVFYTTTNANKRIKREPFIQGYKGTNKSGVQLADKESTTTGTFAIGNIIIKDTSFNGDASAFKTSLLGTVGIFALKEPTTETALPYQSPQIVDDFGTEEYVSTGIVPVGHETKYLANLRDKIQHLPDLADDDGYYVIQQTGHDMSLVYFRIPQAPTTDGTYTLKATVTDGAPTYTWENEQEVNTNEG